jgi:hypothetical protein
MGKHDTDYSVANYLPEKLASSESRINPLPSKKQSAVSNIP